MIPYGRQQISQQDIEAVTDVLRSDYLTQGPIVPQFEKAVATYCGAKHAVAVNSATSALHIACAALDLGPGDWLWTTPITFVASANCGLYCGAQVDFVDIDPRTCNLCPKVLAEKLAVVEQKGRLPKVVVPVHLAGQSCEMVAIHALSERYGFRIVEDASHAIGGNYQSEPVGCGRYSDATVFSFHPVKIITTGEGGMAVTNDPKLAECMIRLRSHGVSRDTEQMTQVPDGPWYYQQVEFGWNYRMTEMQGALGVSQMERLDEFVSRRRELAVGYDEELADLPLRLPGRLEDADSSWHLYVIRLENPAWRREVFEAVREAGIGVNLHYILVHLQLYYERLGFARGDFPAAEDYYDRAISIPLHPGMMDEDHQTVIETLCDVLH